MHPSPAAHRKPPLKGAHGFACYSHPERRFHRHLFGIRIADLHSLAVVTPCPSFLRKTDKNRSPSLACGSLYPASPIPYTCVRTPLEPTCKLHASSASMRLRSIGFIGAAHFIAPFIHSCQEALASHYNRSLNPMPKRTRKTRSLKERANTKDLYLMIEG